MAPWCDGFAGYERFSGLIAGQALARLFALVGLYSNYFQPSLQLIAREKNGSRTRKRYDRPQTPGQRLLAHPAVTEDAKAGLRASSSNLDPLSLLNQIRQAQSALAAPASPEERWQRKKRKNCRSSWPGCPISGARAKPIPPGGPSNNAPDGGGHTPIR